MTPALPKPDPASQADTLRRLCRERERSASVPLDASARAGLLALGFCFLAFAGVLWLAAERRHKLPPHGEPTGALYRDGRFYCLDAEGRAWPSAGECD